MLIRYFTGGKRTALSTYTYTINIIILCYGETGLVSNTSNVQLLPSNSPARPGYHRLLIAPDVYIYKRLTYGRRETHEALVADGPITTPTTLTVSLETGIIIDLHTCIRY